MARVGATALVFSIMAGATMTALAATSGGGQAQAGKEVALEICSYCHVVAPDQPFKPEMKQVHPPSIEFLRCLRALRGQAGWRSASSPAMVHRACHCPGDCPMSLIQPYLARLSPSRVLRGRRDELCARIRSIGQ